MPSYPTPSFPGTSVLPSLRDVPSHRVRFLYRLFAAPRLVLLDAEPLRETGRRSKQITPVQNGPFPKSDTQQQMDKLTQNPVSTPRRKSERRASRRCKFNQLMRIRPSDPQRQHFDDMRGTISVSRTGVYFQTSETGYEVGMRLFLIMPYSQDPGATNREYLAEVVRKDPLPNGLTGIGVKLLLETGPQHTYSFDPPLPSK
jgi:hypothetical protein